MKSQNDPYIFNVIANAAQPLGSFSMSVQTLHNQLLAVFDELWRMYNVVVEAINVSNSSSSMCFYKLKVKKRDLDFIIN